MHQIFLTMQVCSFKKLLYPQIIFSSSFSNALQPLIQAGNKAVGVMKAGQTFTIEPMINAGIFEKLFLCILNSVLVAGYTLFNLNKISIGVWRDRMWPDGWADVTADGKRSAQFEHTLLVTVWFLCYVITCLQLF